MRLVLAGGRDGAIWREGFSSNQNSFTSMIIPSPSNCRYHVSLDLRHSCILFVWTRVRISSKFELHHDITHLYLLGMSFLNGASAFLHRSSSLQIAHFGRQHQRTSIIPLVEVSQHLRRLARLVFLDEMTRFWEDLKLVFSYNRIKISPCSCQVRERRIVYLASVQ